MADVPKIVVDRLRAAGGEQVALEPVHPDADLLTAFAEQTLMATERDGVLGHLARCGDCREVIALAFPAADPIASPLIRTEAEHVPPIPANAERSWLTSVSLAWPRLAWPGLRWAALAAGVVLAGSLLLMHPGKVNQTTQNQATLHSGDQHNATMVPPASGAQAAASPAPSSPLANSTARQAVPVLTKRERVEPILMARNDAPPIHKAKPAVPGVEVEDLVITAGVLQQSLDNGLTWQEALRADHPLLCYASHGQDIWAGGEAGTLFHSADYGASWVQVQPSVQTAALISDITHIDLLGDLLVPAEIVLSTRNNETWSSADGGTTWEK